MHTESVSYLRFSDSNSLSGSHILVVEDAEESRVILQVLLEHEGAKVATAEDGFAALAYLNDHDIDVILMDIQMPGLNGFETLDLVRQKGYQGPILAITAGVDGQEQHRCAAAGFAAQLPKSISRRQLREELRKHMPNATKGVVNTMTTHSKENPAYIDPALRPIIDGIFKRLPEKFLEIQNAIDNQDWETISMTAHRLKGTLGGCGFQGLSDIAAALEEEARKSGNFARAQNLLKSLETATANLKY